MARAAAQAHLLGASQRLLSTCSIARKGVSCSARRSPSKRGPRGLDSAGHPIRLPNIDPSPEGTYIWPGVQGATNWYSPSYNPLTKLFYLSVWENRSVYHKGEQEYSPGQPLHRQRAAHRSSRRPRPRRDSRTQSANRRARLGTTTCTPNPGPECFPPRASWCFGGSDEGHFFALDAETGKEVWRQNLGGIIRANPVTYLVHGRQFVSVAAGNALFTFALQP